MGFLNSRMPQMPGPMGNMMNLMQRFQQFQRTFQGDPKQQVQQLMSSGKFSQEQYNQAAQQANAFMKMLGGKF